MGCGRAQKPGVYAKLQPNLDWMSHVMSESEGAKADLQNRMMHQEEEEEEEAQGR